ncbi:hypothetical protein NQ317_005980, partial [Molorchus minor]
LLKNHPEYLQLFPFKDVPLKELHTNKKYRAHGNSIIYAFSSIVDSTNDNELLVSILTKIGESHVPRKVTEQGFLDLKERIIELFSSLFNEEEMDAWKKALEVVFKVTNDAIREKLKIGVE